MSGYDTEYIKDAISRCDDIEELKNKILPMLKTQQELWLHKFNAILSDSGYTKTRFADICGVSRVTVDKWCKGAIPKNRETFLKIGMAARYDMEQMNQLLQRYGQYPALYSKSLADCVCIFVVNHYSGKDDEPIEKYRYIMERIKENIIRSESDETDNMSTVKFDEKLSEVKDEEALEQFIADNIAMFSYSYHKFYAYVKMCIDANYKHYSNSVFDMAEGQGWSSSLRQCVSAIRQNKWYPTRNKIISLGLHLSMDHSQIDEMLKLAHMEPLCAQNIFESVIMYVLDDASINDMLEVTALDFNPDELCGYARRVIKTLNLPELEFFITELPEEDDV